jgi:putative tryptophan/tyrosine transport system substrate-binding protein
MQFGRLKRREAISLLGGAAAGWPVRGERTAGELPTIGYLGSGTPASQRQWVSAFRERLRELGWIEGRTVACRSRRGPKQPSQQRHIACWKCP